MTSAWSKHLALHVLSGLLEEGAGQARGVEGEWGREEEEEEEEEVAVRAGL